MVKENKALQINQSIKAINEIKADPDLSIREKRKKLYKFKHLQQLKFQNLLDTQPDQQLGEEKDEEDINNFFSNFTSQSIMNTKCLGCVQYIHKQVDLSIYQKHQNYILLKEAHINAGIIYKSITAVLNIGGGYILFAKNSIGQSLITEGFDCKNQKEVEAVYKAIKMAMQDVLPNQYDLNYTVVPFVSNGLIIRVAAFPKYEQYRPFYKMILNKPSFHYFKDGQIREVKPKDLSMPFEQSNPETNCYLFMHQKFSKVSNHYGLACESTCEQVDGFLSRHSAPQNIVNNNKQKFLSLQECSRLRKQLIQLHSRSRQYQNMLIYIPHKNVDPLTALGRLDNYISSKEENQRKYQVVDVTNMFNYKDKNSYLVLCDLGERFIKQLEERNDFKDCIVYGIRTQIKFNKVLPNSYYQACSENLAGIFGVNSKLLLISVSQKYSKHYKEKVHFQASLNIMGSQLPKMQSFITFYYLYLHELKPEISK